MAGAAALVAGLAAVLDGVVIDMVQIPVFTGNDDVRHRPKALAELLLSLHE